MGEFRMPSLGADMDAGTVSEWRVHPGDHVARGDIVAVVKTDKADVEVEVFESGAVGELLVAEGEHVPVGTPLATIVEEGTAAEAGPVPEAAGAPATATTPGPPPAGPEAPPSPPAAPSAPQVPPRRAPTPPPTLPAVGPAPRGTRVSPRARHRAAELGVDVEALAAARPGAAVTGADVEQAVARGGPAAEPAAAAPTAGTGTAAGAPTSGPGETSPGEQATAMRVAIGRLMARSKREIPHYYLEHHIDLSAALERLRADNAARPVSERVLPAALLCRAVALAARETPTMNGFWVDDGFRPGSGVHLGVAIALRSGGLVAPAIHDADTLSVEELMAALRDLTGRARAGRLRGSEMSDPTITVTMLGDRGVEVVHGVIYAPQVALVGFGAVVDRPWAAHGAVEVRPVVAATLAADHRASDGHLGARFLAAIAHHLEDPEEL